MQNHLIVGKVEKGKQLGRTIGFPTANLRTSSWLEKGVYGVRVFYDAICYQGIMNIGTRPTFEDGEHTTIEVHILDFHQDVYDQYITVQPLFYIRAEQQFADLSALIEQLHHDKATMQYMDRRLNQAM